MHVHEQDCMDWVYKYILTQILKYDELLAKNRLNLSPLVINNKSRCRRSQQKEEPNKKNRNMILSSVRFAYI